MNLSDDQAVDRSSPRMMMHSTPKSSWNRQEPAGIYPFLAMLSRNSEGRNQPCPIENEVCEIDSKSQSKGEQLAHSYIMHMQ